MKEVDMSSEQLRRCPRVSLKTRVTRLTKRWLVRGVSVKLLAAVSLASAVACSDSGPAGPETPVPGPNDSVAGAFTLTTVNTMALPYTLFNDSGFQLEIASSTLAMQTGGQFVLALVSRETVGGQVSLFADTTRGTYTQNAGTIRLTDTDGVTAPATWDGERLAFQMDSEDGLLALVYRKQP